MTKPILRKETSTTVSSISHSLQEGETPSAPGVDPKELAKEIYKLMKEDLRRERERQGKP